MVDVQRTRLGHSPTTVCAGLLIRFQALYYDMRHPMLKASTFSASTSMRFTLRTAFIQFNPGIAIMTDRVDVPGRSRSRILLW